MLNRGTEMDLTKYKYVVGYGIGQYFDYVKAKLPKELHVDFLCDTKWQQLGDTYYDLPVISPEKLKEMQDVFVLVFSGNVRNYESICSILRDMKLPFAHANTVLKVSKTVTGKELKKMMVSFYEDPLNNKIFFSQDIEDNIVVSFLGENNEVHIGANVSVESLKINLGNNAYCKIGKGTEIEECAIHLTDGSVMIGEECLFSHQVILRNHDTHHIFDKQTGKRINFSGNILIGNHVWVGHGATLLGNASIGDNSIVGTMAVTSASFPKEVIIAGNPAKIIREGVCWSKDNTNFYQRENLSDCLAQEAFKYV